MPNGSAAKQFSFRLPLDLVKRVEHCAQELRAAGLDVTRADVVRLLLKRGLDAGQCKLQLSFGLRPSNAKLKKRPD